MQHFSESAWVDFARDVATTDVKMAMQTHLEGCTKCAATLQMWQSVNTIARMEGVFTPHSDVVRVVKSQFATMVLQAALGLRLLFDSSLEPAPAGFRGAAAVRQLLYETDEYYIDLRVEPRNESNRIAVVGQVVSRTGKEHAAQGLDVRLQEGKRLIAGTSTNQFGEFQLEFKAASSLCISVSRDKSNEIVLPLYEIEENPPDANA